MPCALILCSIVKRTTFNIMMFDSTQYYLKYIFKPLFLDTAGVVPCGGHKTSPRTSTIVQFIFYFWSFEISMTFLRNKKYMIGLDLYSR